jgi:predicted DNA-binding transcriptional regulator AlpA
MPVDMELQGRRLINRKELRQRVPVSDMSIWRWMKAGIFPKPVKINRRNYWRSDEIDRFLEGTQ